MLYYEYSSDVFPSIPVCKITLGRSKQPAEIGPFVAILDTGADISVIPTHILRQVGAQWIGKGNATSVWGDSRKTNIYIISLQLGTHYFSTVEVLEDTKGKEIIIGRYVLNWLRITFDGLSQYVEISE